MDRSSTPSVRQDIAGRRLFVDVILVNWNGWRHTIECLESVLRSDYPAFRVIVCDNGSTDGSVDRIRAWADGRLAAVVDPQNPLKRLSSPPIPKPVPCVVLEGGRAEAGGGGGATDALLTVIALPSNLGFAGGNNAALRHALSRRDFGYVWLLNNDTVVEPDALSRLAERASADPGAGIIGSALIRYDDPGVIEAVGGGTWNRWLGTSRHFASGARFASGRLPRPERRPDFILGTSMFVSRQFLDEVGLLSEEYFLYCEEVDWALRARSRFPLAVEQGSVVYHKQGAATGGIASRPSEKSAFSDYFLVRSRLLLTRKFFPLALPTVYAGLAGTIVNRLRRRQWGRVGMIARIAAGFAFGRCPPPPPAVNAVARPGGDFPGRRG